MLAIGVLSAVTAGGVFAQTGSSTTTTTTGTSTGTTSAGVTTTSSTSLDGTGTITTYTPGVDYLSMRTETGTAPVKYYYTKSTTIVDPEGKTVEWSMLKPDMPVRYTYMKDGDRMVISKVTLVKPISYYETKDTTTTTTTTTKP